jgi:hypothetical protein
MNRILIISSSTLLLAFSLAGCASDGSLELTTASINQQKPAAKAVDPACIALSARIAELRKEGTPDRIAKVAAGKTKTAHVKREALARMTDLDAANKQFQQKCSTLAAPKTPPKTANATQGAATDATKAAATAVKAAAQPAKAKAATAKSAAAQKVSAATTAAKTAALAQ